MSVIYLGRMGRDMWLKWVRQRAKHLLSLSPTPLSSLVRLQKRCDLGVIRLEAEGAELAQNVTPCCAMCAFFCETPSSEVIGWAHSHGLNGGDGADATRTVCETMQHSCADSSSSRLKTLDMNASYVYDASPPDDSLE